MSTTHGNYRSCIYSMASVMQREREAIDVGALTNIMAAGESVVTRNVSVKWNTTARVSDIE